MAIFKFKQTGHIGLFDQEETSTKLSILGNPLEKLHKIIGFEMFRSELEEQMLNHDKKSNAGCKPYPVTDWQLNNEGKMAELFTVNASAYLQNAFTPNQNYSIAETGALRAQQYVALDIQPIQFNPATGVLQVATEMVITLSFVNPTTAVNVNTGIFNNVATNTFLNYEDQGIKASINDKAFEKANFTSGKVKWIDIINPNQADTIVADYLIICAEPFFSPRCSEVQRIANHRATYNGFDVAILNVEHILSDNVGFEYEHSSFKKEQRIRTCIRRIYEGAHAANTYDGKLGYVLLIGNVDENNTGMPSAYEGIPMAGSHDYYFSCVTRNGTLYDKFGDLYIGRFCVPNNVDPEDGLQKLHNMVEKTIFFESEHTFGGWRNNFLSEFNK